MTRSGKASRLRARKQPEPVIEIFTNADSILIPQSEEPLPDMVFLSDYELDEDASKRLAGMLLKIAQGLPLAQAAGGSGLTLRFVKNLIQQSPQFSKLYDLAVSRFAQATLAALKESNQSWQRYAWLLERRFPEEFGQGSLLRISDADMQVLNKLGMTPQAAWQALMTALNKQLQDDEKR